MTITIIKITRIATPISHLIMILSSGSHHSPYGTFARIPFTPKSASTLLRQQQKRTQCAGEQSEPGCFAVPAALKPPTGTVTSPCPEATALELTTAPPREKMISRNAVYRFKTRRTVSDLGFHEVSYAAQ
jgi:hypothetical protein